jgi:hypothetical protein
MERGYVAIFRKIFDSDVWAHPTARIVWIYILGNVAHERRKLGVRYQCVSIDPGQMVTGRKKLADECHLTEQQARTALAYLISTGRITIKSTNRFTTITVINWQIYRIAQLKNNQQITSREPADNHIQEVKKLRIEERSKSPSSKNRDDGAYFSSNKDRQDHEFPKISERIYKAWTESFGEAPGKGRLEVLKSFTDLQRLGYTEDDIQEVIDYYAQQQNVHRWPPVEFFQKENFRVHAERAGIEWEPPE